MSLIDDVKRDREAGTDGPWHCHFGDEGAKCNCQYVLAEYGGMGSIATLDVCEDMAGYWGDDNGPDEPQSKANARRICRVPDMEAALLAADEHARASDNRLGKWMSAALSDPETCEEMKSDINAWFSTLSTYRKAVEGK